MRRSFHNGLRSRELEIRIEAIDHGMITVAVDEVAQVSKTQRFIELGVSATRYVEVEPILCQGDSISRLPPPAQSSSTTVLSDARSRP